MKHLCQNSLELGPPANVSSHTATADTAATGNFFSIGTSNLLNVQPNAHPITVCLPDHSTIESTHTALLDIPELPIKAREAHLFPALNGNSLLSISKLCASGCIATFDQTSVKITLHGKVILQGKKCPHTNLWQVPLKSTPTKQLANSITYFSTRAKDMVQFSHASLFSPRLSTLLPAIEKGWLYGFPGLSISEVTKFPPLSTSTSKGHLDQTRAGQHSTKNKDPLPEDIQDMYPPPLPGGRKTHYCYAAVEPIVPTGQIYSDQTGKFPITSTRGNAYVFILYDYDSNNIMAEPIKNREASSILAAYKICHEKLCKAGLRPKLQRLDNECSATLKDFMHDEEIDFQLAPPGIHRRNAAERAIRTWKNHFIAGLCSTDPNFPLNLWDRLIPQANITLSLLRGSRLNPTNFLPMLNSMASLITTAPL